MPAPSASVTLKRTLHANRSQRGRRLDAFAQLVLLFIGIGWIYPFLWMVSASLKDNTEVLTSFSLIPEHVTWTNFARAWWDADIGTSFFNTVAITVASVAIVIATTSMIGYVLGRYAFPGRKVILTILVGSVFVPEGYTIIPVFELVNALQLDSSLLGIILAEAGSAHVLFILLFAGFFRQLPRELAESAEVDGAGFLRQFWNIMLPLAKPVIATTGVLQFMSSWNSYFLPLVLTLSKPELRTLGVGMLAFRGEFYSDWSGLAAAATISQLPIILLFLLLQRYFVEGIAGAVKS